MISDSYRELNRRLHETIPEYGTSGHKFAQHALNISRTYKTSDFLDYGCGKATLADNLPFPIKCYDPAIEKYSALPEPADVVMCTDVMEHIEPDHLDAVLDDLKRLCRMVCYVSIASRPAQKILADGRNAHLIQEPYEWWLPKLWRRFNIIEFVNMSNKEYLLLLHPLSQNGSTRSL